MTGREHPIQSLEAIADARSIRKRDCRECRHFQSQCDGLEYGWCQAHQQFVKLYHPAGGFWSQCQFKALARDRQTPRPGGPAPGSALGG